ncbi:uncharacterized protein [Fopius arisanus]|uniref:Uncharacterized protein isoform X2 n=1 Tax=Fopius arisanus TaxID=64838 RepID=A0A9R1SWA3_9HYME|nr:PREDICTED: uncharacterized protein LOC105263664 isoform X2 [Fopius arisanus]
MNNVFINIWKFFKFVHGIISEKMLAGRKNEEVIEGNSGSDYLGIMDGNSFRNFSLVDLPGICGELECIVNNLKNSTNIEYLLYDYPGILEERLRDNIGEIEVLLKEIKSVNSNIQQLNQQHLLFSKEQISLKKTLKKLKDNEIREMETVVSLFDNAMFIQWENAKNSRKVEVLERFLSDVMSKQLALENLNILATRKLTNLKKYPKGKVTNTKFIESNSAPTLSPENPEVQKIPPAPPLPHWPLPNFTNCNLFFPTDDPNSF